MGGTQPERRLWQCPGCSRVFRIPASAVDPSLCPDCETISGKEQPPAEPVDEPLPPIVEAPARTASQADERKVLAAMVVIAFFAWVVWPAGQDEPAPEASQSKPVITPQTPQASPARVDPVGSGIPIGTRKRIYAAYYSALKQSMNDPRWQRLERAIETGDIQQGGQFIEQQNEIDNEYIQRLVLNRFGISESQYHEILVEGIKSKWPMN